MTAEEILSRHENRKLAGLKYKEQDIILAMKEYARIKCLEAIRNTRHKSYDIVNLYGYALPDYHLSDLARDIMNINSDEVMPKFD